jgi:flagellar FliL protein
MADDDVDNPEENTEENTEEGNSGGKKKLIIFIVIGIVLIGISIGGTLFAVKMLAPEPVVEESVDDAVAEGGNPIVEEEEVKKGYAIYFPLKPPIIVNFQARGRQRFLQADITLMTREDDVVEAIETHMPMIRNALVLKFGGQTYEELQTEEGRELLRQESLEELQNIMLQEIDKTGIEKLLFTNFVMQ